MIRNGKCGNKNGSNKNHIIWIEYMIWKVWWELAIKGIKLNSSIKKDFDFFMIVLKIIFRYDCNVWWKFCNKITILKIEN